jgi:cytochrome c-type biogenesis protein CcmH
MQPLLTTHKLRPIAILLLGTIVLLGAGDDSTRIERLGHQMMCVCGACNQYLLECNHVGCAYSTRMREELVANVSSGQSDSSILQFFIEKYGAAVLAAPTRTGFDRVAWIIPYIALLLGAAIVFIATRVLKRRFATVAAQSTPIRSSELDRFRAQARKETEL